MNDISTKAKLPHVMQPYKTIKMSLNGRLSSCGRSPKEKSSNGSPMLDARDESDKLRNKVSSNSF